ncbi:hypothetical protein B484DRAFT_442994 [Ochromonadaceae sp. CCMP2298]|nr:hypothetical protein B484DRAFT_442994 [Ochromonadaceae sp. CCMP2298]
MSEEERKEALEEVQALLSPRNIAFLRGGKSSAGERSEGGATVKSEAASSSAAQSATAEAAKLSDATPPPPPTSIFDETPVGGDAQTSLDGGPRTSVLPSVLAAAERFDLVGRKVVQVQVALQTLRSELADSGLLKALGEEQLEQAVQIVRRTCLEPLGLADAAAPPAQPAMRTGTGHDFAPFFLVAETALLQASGQPQDELRHHQFEPSVPGYSLREMGEMLRSQFAGQRAVALRMLAGVLLRRDCVVALEAYGEAFAREEAAARASVREVPAACCIEDELGRKTQLFHLLSRHFEDTVTALRGHIVSAAQAGQDSLSLEQERALRRILGRCLVPFLCASDLPVELPTLMLWALNAPGPAVDYGSGSGLALPLSFGSNAPRNNPAAVKLALLRLLGLYLRSPVEDLCRERLQANASLWGTLALPRMPTPHTRRPELGYELHGAECSSKAASMLRGEGRGGEALPGETLPQRFALQCRWARVDALTQHGGLVQLLGRYVRDAAELVLERVQAAGNLSSSSSSSIPASSGIPIDLGMISLDLLVGLVRHGDGDTAALVRSFAFNSVWPLFAQLVDSSLGLGLGAGAEEDEGDSATDAADDGASETSQRTRGFHSSACRLRCLWWRLLRELAGRETGVARALFQERGEWTGAAAVQLLRRRGARDGGIWGQEAELMLQLLQVCAVYGCGLRCVGDLLLAWQVQEVAQAAPLASSDSGVLDAQLLLLLEQCCVSASSVLAHHAGQGAGAGGSAVSQAVELSSSVLTFVKRHWRGLCSAALGWGTTSDERRFSTAAAALLCAVLPSSAGDVFANAEASGTSRGAVETWNAHAAVLVAREARLLSVRGPGLAAAVARFAAESVLPPQEGGDGPAQAVGSQVLASVLHLKGQCEEIVRLVQQSPAFEAGSIADVARVRAGAGGVAPAEEAVLASEQALFLQRLLHCAAMARLQLAAPPAEGGASSGSLDEVNTLMALERQVAALAAPTGNVPGVVSRGLFCWHEQRVRQASLLARVSFLANLLLSQVCSNAGLAVSSFVGGELISCICGSLHSLTAHTFRGPMAKLLQLFLCYTVQVHARSDGDGESRPALPARVDEFASAELDELWQAIYTGALQLQDKDDNEALNAALDGYLGLSGARLCSLVPAADASLLPPPRLSPNAQALDRDWTTSATLRLSDRSLAMWLRMLRETPLDAESAAPRLFTLLKLSAADQSKRWLGLAESTAAATLTVAFAEGETSPESGPPPEANMEAVDAYRRLLARLLLVGCEGLGGPGFAAHLAGAAQKDFSATTGVMSTLQSRPTKGSRTGTRAFNAQMLEGLMDLCEKALDAGLNLALAQELHAAVLLVLAAAPCLPWTARLRVWRQISSLRVLHLLEDSDFIQQLLPVLLLPLMPPARCQGVAVRTLACESLGLCTAMVDTLRSLRSEQDRLWDVVAVTLCQLALFTFCGGAGGPEAEAIEDVRVISGSGAQLLLYVIAGSEEPAADWLLRGLLGATAHLPALRQALQGNSSHATAFDQMRRRFDIGTGLEALLEAAGLQHARVKASSALVPGGDAPLLQLLSPP